MSDTEFDVVIAAYLIPDLAQQDFDALVAIYDRGKASTVDATLASAVKKSVAQVDGHGAKKLKAALADAQAGLDG
jgi:hypothetical protein